MTTYTGEEIAKQGLDGWVYLPGGLQTRIATPDFAAGVELVAAIGTATAAKAPSFWVLADPEGNKVCLCTWQDRGDLVDF